MVEEKVYIGVKVIKATPMNEFDFHGWTPRPNNEDREGYKVTYPGGYESWSPKEVFEICYRNITGDILKLIGE